MRALTVMGFLRAMLGQALGSEGLQRAYDSAQGAMRAMQAGIGTSRAASLDTYGGDPELVRQLLPLLDFLHDRYFRVTAHGTEHLPTGPAVLVANHSGALPLDGPMLKLALARAGGDLDRARWLLEDQVFYAPFLGTLLNRLGAVRASPENAVRLLGEGHPLIVFPEGIHGIGKPFTERYRLKRFGRGGFVKLALRLKVPIVPVAIVGAEESMPLFGKLPGGPFDVPYLPITSPLPLPAHWIIRFGPPIDLAGEAPGAEDDLARVHKLNERTRATIQQMLDEALRERTSVFKR